MAAPTLAGVLLARAEAHPASTAYEQPDPAGGLRTLTYAQLAARATALAGDLAASGTGPVLLAQPAGTDYAVAVFAGFLAGRPVIPAFPHETSSPDRGRLAGIIADARPTAVVAPLHDPQLGVPVTLSVPGAEADTTPWSTPSVTARPDVAVIQYTSGSTGRPRGVLVRHESLAANTAAIAERFGLTGESKGLTWLPPFHDMGLVGGLLTPVVAGIPVRVLAPQDFLKSPLWWLHQISQSGATASGGPNFAFDLCVRRVRSPGQLDGLDLSGWQVAFNGGERVRAGTLAEFARTFAPAGFRSQAFLPCYGLAEATLIVSAGRWSGHDRDAHEPVGCGTPVTGQQVRIVDPAGPTAAADGEEGEIWIRGAQITDGYLSGDPDGLFGELDGVRYLRTGDLGRLRNGELTVTGRIKDVIVFRGVNHHAADVEAAALAEAGDCARRAAAFLDDTGRNPVPVLVLEVGSERDEALAVRIRTAVLARTGLRLGHVVITGPGSVPRTSSGKVRRSACRDALAAGAYAEAVCIGDTVAAAARSGEPTAAADDGSREACDRLAGLVAGIAAEVCEIEDCPPDVALMDLGMDSVRAAEAAAVLEHALAMSVPLQAVLGAATSRGVAARLVTHWAEAGIAPREVIDRIQALDSVQIGTR